MQARDLRALEGRVNAQNRNRLFLLREKLVHAHDNFLTAFDRPLVFEGGFLDFSLDVAALNGSQHSSKRAAHGVNFLEVIGSARFDFIVRCSMAYAPPAGST